MQNIFMEVKFVKNPAAETAGRVIPACRESFRLIWECKKDSGERK